MVGKPTLRINAIKLNNGAKASDFVGLKVLSSESEALAPKKKKNSQLNGIPKIKKNL